MYSWWRFSPFLLIAAFLRWPFPWFYISILAPWFLIYQVFLLFHGQNSYSQSSYLSLQQTSHFLSFLLTILENPALFHFPLRICLSISGVLCFYIHLEFCFVLFPSMWRMAWNLLTLYISINCYWCDGHFHSTPPIFRLLYLLAPCTSVFSKPWRGKWRCAIRAKLSAVIISQCFYPLNFHFSSHSLKKASPPMAERGIHLQVHTYIFWRAVLQYLYII